MAVGIFENMTGGERVQGIDAVRLHVAALHTRWPDMRFVESDVGLVSGQDHIGAEWTAHATRPDRWSHRC